jgi:hypothetical protein
VRLLRFAGHDFLVKTSENATTGPGANYFGGRGAFVDEAGLHLTALLEEGKLYCSEVMSLESFGFGTYSFDLGSDPTRIDSNLVLGLFTWRDSISDDHPEYGHRELDIELSRWGQPDNPENADYITQPYSLPEHMLRFFFPTGFSYSTHTLAWSHGIVRFTSSAGGRVVRDQVMNRQVPESGGETVHFNLWSVKPRLAGDGITEVVIKNFSFKPE